MVIENPVTLNTGTVTPVSSGTIIPVTPAPAIVQPPAAVKPAVPTSAVVKPPEPQTVPIGAMLEERTKRQALEAELNILKQQIQQPQYQQPMQQPPNQVAQELEKLWETDPRRAVQAEMMLGFDWYDRINNSIGEEADILAGRYADFPTWRTTAERYVRTLPLQQRAQRGALEMAFFVVRGQNTPGILQQQNDELMRKFQTGELASSLGTPSGMVSSPTPRSSVTLTDEQRAAANAMGVSEDDYIKYSKPGVR